ncbi:MAG: NUDIX hydrolase [Chloroflexia bacterium]
MEELQALRRRLGPLPSRHERIRVDRLLLHRLAGKGGSLQEVVLVAHRPDGRVLLHTKRFYPAGVWRLPSGRLKEGESPEAAAQREAFEELGLAASPQQLLGLLTYELEGEGETLPFASWIFGLAAGDLRPAVQDREEEISDFRWAAATELRAVAEQMDALPPPWQGWGRFRAAAHAFVADLLARGGRNPITEGYAPWR